MSKCFYLRLALSNIRRDRRTYLPHMLSTSVISAVYLLIAGLMSSDTLTNVPSGETASTIFAFGLVVFTLFVFFFMVYINKFLINRRKKEFGLYGILGLEKRHVSRVLVWENLITLTAGVALGVLLALVFGRLIFMLLVRIIHAAVAGSSFSIGSMAYALTFGLFFIIFAVTSLSNLVSVRTSSPMELMQSEKKGEKESRFFIAPAIIGVLALGAAYYLAWIIESPAAAIGLFFLLVTLVIIATYLLFSSGSIALLNALKKNRRIFYKPRAFIAISGLRERMKQNARSLATICILSTMLVVTMSGTLSLYLGREQMYAAMYPYDARVYIGEDATESDILDSETELFALARKHGVTLSADRSKIVYGTKPEDEYATGLYVSEEQTLVGSARLVSFGRQIRFDVDGAEESCLAFMDDVRKEFQSASDIFTSRLDGYGLYGGLLFLGVFFSLLFLAVTVLVIYFKQISEGMEDRARFTIMQKVGMGDAEVRSAINSQVLMVFFVPLGMTLLHMVFASRIMARMLKVFMLYDWGLVLTCIGGTAAVFALIYLAVYLITSRVYYSMVRER